MPWSKREREPPTVNVTVVNDGNRLGKPEEQESAEEAKRDNDKPKTREELAVEALERIRPLTSLRGRVKAWLSDFGWVTFLLGAVALFVLLSEWWLVILSAVIANVAMYGYTKWVHKPPVVPVVQYDDDGTGGMLGAWLIPVEIWNEVAKIGLSNAIVTSYGVTYMVRAITWAKAGNRLVPVAIEFSWLHYNELNFATKRGMFQEIREALRVRTELVNRYKWLMDNMVLAKALGLLQRWITTMSHGRHGPLARQDAATLRSEIERLAKEDRENRMPELRNGETPLLAEDEGAPTL